jgi:hypothetical protein
LKIQTKGNAVKGIDKRTHKDGTVSYRARVRIKGHPVLIQSFASKTLAMKWKRDTESAVEQGKYAYVKPGSKNTLAELIDRYIERVLPSKQKNARNVRQHLLWWKQEMAKLLLPPKQMSKSIFCILWLGRKNPVDIQIDQFCKSMLRCRVGKFISVVFNG